MTSATDNRTTELLREGLTERGVEWRSGLEGVTFVGDWCFVEYDNGKLAATCEPVLTPEQVIAATLGNARAERTCKFVSSKGSDYPPVCSACGYELGIYDCEWFEDGTYGYDGNYWVKR